MISAIVPCCNEYPQILFTVQNLLNSGVGEVVVVSNKSTDKTNEYFGNLRNRQVKFVKYDDKQSHWQAKNKGIEASSYSKLLFIDGHCIVDRTTIKSMHDLLNSKECAVHARIKYMLDERPLEYELRAESLYYRFCTARTALDPYEVPVMSCCGVMIRESTIARLGGWNDELGIYGGGEQYMNFKLATCGCPQYIHPQATVYHYADRRGYSWNHTDWVRNLFIAAFCVGGVEWVDKLIKIRSVKDHPDTLELLKQDVVRKCKKDRDFIASYQTMSLDEYFAKWT